MTNQYSKEQNIIIEILRENIPYETDSLGKMVRSKLGLLILDSAGMEITQECLVYLAVVELIHNASLLHDDVIDGVEVRRGVSNIIKKYSSKSSILFGNIITSNAVKMLNNMHLYEPVSIICETVNNMCKGELLQQASLNMIPSLDDYLKKTELKTASLFVAVYDGLNSISDYKIPDFYLSYLKNFGIAFQIKNDLDDVLSVNSDKLNGIYTVPYIYSKDKILAEGSIEKTLSLIDNYIEKSINSLSNLRESTSKTELIGVVKCLKD